MLAFMHRELYTCYKKCDNCRCIFKGGIYMDDKTKRAKALYEKTNHRLRALSLPFFLNGWEEERTPKMSKPYRNGQLVELSAMGYAMRTGKGYMRAIETLYSARDELDPVLRHEIEQVKHDCDKLAKVPKDKYLHYQKVLLESFPQFVEAKNTADFSLVKASLGKILSYKLDYVKWQQTDELKGYDVLLDEYERGMTMEKYDQFFGLIKSELVPFIKKVLPLQKPVHPAFTTRRFPAEKQKKFCEYLGGVMLFDKDKTMMGESEHPYTSNNGNCDVRITNHYYENDLSSAIFSAIHEMGHGLYELQVDASLQQTMSGGGASMALHESQSRFFENYVGRSKQFWHRHFPVLKEIFKEELEGVEEQDFFNYVNHAQASLVRTDADELTYPLHVLIRYEIEKDMMAGTVTEKNVEQVWNEKYKEYLGIDVPDAGRGVVQDMHWYGGSIGYFPTYALGSAYAAQILAAMGKDFDVHSAMGDENVEKIAAWLKEHIHKYGSSKSPAEVFEGAVGGQFDARYYIDYLKKKYSALCGIGADE